MADHIPLIDAELASARPLQVRAVEPRTFQPLADHFAALHSERGAVFVEHDEQRDGFLADYRVQFREQVLHDVAFNLQRLHAWAQRLDSGCAALADGGIRDGFARLARHRSSLTEHDAWGTNRAELACWNAFHQFYCDAISLGERLLRFEQGKAVVRRQAALPRRLELPAVSSPSVPQTLVNIAEQGVPNFIHLRPLRSLAPVLAYVASHVVCPWPAFEWRPFLRHAGYLVTSGGFAGWATGREGRIECRGAEEVFENPELFDPINQRTKHNIILAFSHRHSLLDLSIIATVLGGIRHGVWASEEFFPGSARRDSKMIVVRPGRRTDMPQVLARSADLAVEQRLPILLAVDGGTPYMPYGQQMRVKRGVRLLVDRLHEYSRDSARKTYIVPFSLCDTVSYLRGMNPTVRVTFHKPICSDDIAPPTLPGNPGLLNWGDPLLTYLETLFLVNTGQMQHGWRTPRVVETVRRVADQRRGGGVRDWIRGCFQASLHDLSRDQSAAEAELAGP